MKISEATKKEQVLATDSIPVGAASSNQAYRIEMSQVNKFVHNNSASTTCDYVEALDATGNPIKISKASLASIVADVIKSNTTQQAKVTFGAGTSAELASVVATYADSTFLENLFNFNSWKEVSDISTFRSGICFKQITNMTGITNGYYTIIALYENTRQSIQIAIGAMGLYYRISNNTVTNWSDWEKIG